jgi:PA domain-containing protein/peptidase M28-like protein
MQSETGVRRWAVLALVVIAIAIAAVAVPPAGAVPAAGVASSSSGPLSAGALYADVVHYARLGDHQTGSASEARTQSWIESRLSSLGLETGRDPYKFFAFDPGAVSLRVAGHLVRPALPYFYSGTTPSAGVSGGLVYVGLGLSAEVDAADVSGKIAVISVPAVKDTIEPSFTQAVTALHSAGAAALVAVTDGPGNLPFQQDVDSRTGILGLPTVFVGKRSGAAVIKAARAAAPATVTLTAGVGEGCDTNVWAVLPGESASRLLIVGTPTSGWDQAASERGSGVAILLGLAHYYASLPVSQRPLTIVFAATSGHEVGYLGLPTLIQTHPAWFSDADAYVHLGASIGALEKDQVGGRTVSGGEGDLSRDLYVSENALLQSIAAQAFTGAQPLGSLPPSVEDPGEQAYAYHAGIPVVSVSGASTYFHTTGDTPSTVGPSVLAAMAAGFQTSVDQIAVEPAGTLREANAAAAELGEHETPNSTPGGAGASDVAADLPEPIASCPGGAERPAAPRAHRSQVLRPALARAAAQPSSGPPGVTVPQSLDPTSPGAPFDTPPPAYPWEGSYKSVNVTFPSAATGAKLFGVLFSPADVSQ